MPALMTLVTDTPYKALKFKSLSLFPVILPLVITIFLLTMLSSFLTQSSTCIGISFPKVMTILSTFFWDETTRTLSPS